MNKFKSLILTMVLAIFWGFLMIVPSSLADSVSDFVFSSQSYYFMDFSGQVNAKSKKLEGQMTENKGKLTNDKGEQIKGKVMQFEGDVMEVTENVEEALEATTKNITDEFKELGEEAQKAFK